MNGRMSNKVQITVKRCCSAHIWGIVMVICLTGYLDTRVEQETEQSVMIESQEIMHDKVGEEEIEPVVNDDVGSENRKKEIMEELSDQEYPDVSELFQKVLRQYEQVLRVTEGMNWDSAWDEFYHGDWKYVDNYLYGDGRFENIYYSIADISGDGFPEMIMGKKSVYGEVWYAYLIYYYNGEDVQMACQGGGRYYLTFYTNDLIELLAPQFIAFYQFQQDDQEWSLIIKIDYEYSADGQTEYLKNDIDAENPDSSLFEDISEEEYQQIIEQYRTTPIDLEWTVLWEVVG